MSETNDTARRTQPSADPDRQQLHDQLDEVLDAAATLGGISPDQLWPFVGALARHAGALEAWSNAGREYADRRTVGPSYTPEEWSRAYLLSVLARMLYDLDQPGGLFEGVSPALDRAGRALAADVRCLLQGWPGGGSVPAILHQLGQQPGVPDRHAAIRTLVLCAHFRKGANPGQSIRMVFEQLVPDVPENTWRGWIKSEKLTTGEERAAAEAAGQECAVLGVPPPEWLNWTDDQLRRLWEMAAIRKGDRRSPHAVRATGGGRLRRAIPE